MTALIQKKLVVTRNSDQRLLKMFLEAYDRLTPKEQASAPVVINR